ncbi:low temperature requirement protein A [Micromonospora halotolerans]|uniref:Low temperature requirement protein A n=1 Tax=Micromonospora halotolerans TaxID=709879 RepID=A0ABZ0A5S5_9ACTN|nr:low temperature requirement protein A [Micromonospora halotolerans]WNM42522.1 low temperature requirement protein A [Micromonospora halotolerans]
MTTGGSSELVRRPNGSTRATLLELLFDVVFVAALALVSMLIADRPSGSDVAQVVIMLMAIWWTWSVTSTTTDFYDPDQRPIQAILMVTMLGAVVTAAALAVNSHALVFAVGYVAPHLIRGVVLVTVLHQHRHMAEQRALRFLFWFVVSSFFWIGGALLPHGWPWTLWAVAITIDYVSAAARYPTPRLGRVPFRQYEKTTEHLGERYQQFIILALGDVILVPTLEISRSEFTLARSAAFLTAFASMLLLWQIYVLRAGSIVRTTAPRLLRRATRLAPYTHLVMLTGVVCTAAASDLVVERPTGETPGRWIALILGGPALFLLGRTLFTYRIVGTFPRHRVFWLVALVAATPWAGGWPPMLVTAFAVLVLAGVVTGDMMGGRRARPPLRGRPG